MTVSPALSASLNAIGNVMGEARDPWWIIASAAVALHGANPGHVADVDVLLSVADAQRILPAIGIELRPGSLHAAFRSRIFGTWTGTALPVEFMADFQRRSGEAWLPVRCPRADGALSSLPASHRQTFLMVEPLGLLAVDRDAVPAQQDLQSPIAKPSALLRQLAQTRPQVAII